MLDFINNMPLVAGSGTLWLLAVVAGSPRVSSQDSTPLPSTSSSAAEVRVYATVALPSAACLAAAAFFRALALGRQICRPGRCGKGQGFLVHVACAQCQHVGLCTSPHSFGSVHVGFFLE